MLNVAIAEPFSGPVPSVVAPSLNVIVPVGVPAALEVTVAVNVTDCPKGDGFSEDVTVAVLAAVFTVCVSAAEVLVAKLALPP